MSDSRKSGSAPVRGLASLQQQYIKSSPRVPIPSSPSNPQRPNLSHCQSPLSSRPLEHMSSQSSLLPPSQKPWTPDSDNMLSLNENEKKVPRFYQLYDLRKLMQDFTPGQSLNIPQSVSIDTSRCKNYIQLQETFSMELKCPENGGDSRLLDLYTKDATRLGASNWMRHSVALALDAPVARDRLEMLIEQLLNSGFTFREDCDFTPHPDTIVKSGEYMYYESDGRQPMPYALAELIDNAISATRDNKSGERIIQIHLYLNAPKPTVAVIDNGSGMNSEELNKWATYKYSRFIKAPSDMLGSNLIEQPSAHFLGTDYSGADTLEDDESDSAAEAPASKRRRDSAAAGGSRPAPSNERFVDGEISYFGAGGKQAVFYIGSLCVMVSKKGPGVSELPLDANYMVDKWGSAENPWKGKIVSRAPGVRSSSPPFLNDPVLSHLCSLEKSLGPSFTMCIIQELKKVQSLTQVDDICMTLAGTYHYYLHGPQGCPTEDQKQTGSASSPASSSSSSRGGSKRPPQISENTRNSGFRPIKITVHQFDRDMELVRLIDLADVKDDAEARFHTASASSFDFRIQIPTDALQESGALSLVLKDGSPVPRSKALPKSATASSKSSSDLVGSGLGAGFGQNQPIVVYGTLRYHPSVYGNETFPHTRRGLLSDKSKASSDDDDELEMLEDSGHRGENVDIFQLFWNGRHIPYSTWKDLPFCSLHHLKHRKPDMIPEECYYRLSGSLFFDEKLAVTNNKLTFQNLSSVKQTISDNASRSKIIFEVSRGGKGNYQRCDLEQEYFGWLAGCHDVYDKTLKFEGRCGESFEADNTLWTPFRKVTWESTFSVSIGSLVRLTVGRGRNNSRKIVRVQRILKHGSADGDGHSYGSNGSFDYISEPTLLYGDQTWTTSLQHIDRNFNHEHLNIEINDEIRSRVPHSIVLFDESSPKVVEEGEYPAGHTIDGCMVRLLSAKGSVVSSLPSLSKLGSGRKREINIIESLTDISRSLPSRILDKKIYEVSKNNSGGWKFELQGNLLTKPGIYKLSFHPELTGVENEATNENLKKLTFSISFKIQPAAPTGFKIGLSSLKPIQLGIPFDVPLLFHDGFGNTTTSLTKEFSNHSIKILVPFPEQQIEAKSRHLLQTNDQFYLKDIVANGIASLPAEEATLTIIFSARTRMDQNKAQLKVKVRPGKASTLSIAHPAGACERGMEIENGSCPTLAVLIRDAAGNSTFDFKGAEIVSSIIANGNGTPILQPKATALQNNEVNTPIAVYFNPVRVAKIPEGGVAELLCTLQLRPITPSFRAPGYSVPDKALEPLKLMLRVRPSSAPKRIALFEEGQDTELDTKVPIVREAGTKLTLTFLLFDESNVPVNLTSEHINKLKLSWSLRADPRSLLRGILAPIDVPQSTSAEAIEHVVSYAEEFHQTIKVRARAGHAAHLIIELSEYSVPVGSKPPPILVKFTDALNNVVEDINDFLPLLHLEADGLDVSQLVPKKTILPKEKSPAISLSGFQFEEKKSCTKTVVVRCKDPPMSASASFKLLHGPLHHIRIETPLLSEGQNKLSIMNGTNFPEIGIKIFDEFDNLVLSPKDLELMIPTTLQLTVKGKISSIIRIRTKNGETSWPSCDSLVRGNCDESYTLKLVCAQVSAELKLKLVAGSVPNQLEPEVEQTTCIVDQALPRCILRIKAENGTLVAPDKLDRTAVLMKMWRDPPDSLLDDQPPPATALQWPPSHAVDDHFVFGGPDDQRHAPTEAGKYNIAFFYSNLDSIHNQIEVLPDRPATLSSIEVMAPETILASSNPQDLIAVKSFILQLKDKFGNWIGELDSSPQFNGQVLLELLSATNPNNLDSTPRLSNTLVGGSQRTLCLQMTRGSCQVPDILLNPSTLSGMHCKHRYLVRFSLVSLEEERRSLSAAELAAIARFEVPFAVVDERAKQERLQKLQREGARLQNEIKQLSTTSLSRSQRRAQLERNVRNAEAASRRNSDALKAYSVIRDRMLNVDVPEDKLRDLAFLLWDDMENSRISTRGCQPPQKLANEDGVIGYIGELGFVENDQIARLISWSIGQREFNCLIVRDRTKGHEMTQRDPSLAVWSVDQMPPRRDRRELLFPEHPGRPRFALDSVVFPEGEHKEIAKTVFLEYLGDTIIMDTKQDAQEYRYKVLNKGRLCPMILCLDDNTQINRRGQTGGPQSHMACPGQLRYLLQKPNRQLPQLRQAHDLVNKQISCIEELNKLTGELAMFNQVDQRDYDSEILAIQRRIQEIDNEIRELNSDEGSEGAPVSGSCQANLHESSARASGNHTVQVSFLSPALLPVAAQSGMPRTAAAPGQATVGGWTLGAQQQPSSFAAVAAAANLESRTQPAFARAFASPRVHGDAGLLQPSFHADSPSAANWARGPPPSARSANSWKP